MQRIIYYLWALPGHKLLLVPDCNLLPPKTNMSTSEFSVNNYPHTWQVISCNYQAQLFKDKSDLLVFNATSIILFGICWGTKRFVSNEFLIKAQFVIQIKFFLISSAFFRGTKCGKISKNCHKGHKLEHISCFKNDFFLYPWNNLLKLLTFIHWITVICWTVVLDFNLRRIRRIWVRTVNSR